MAADSYTWTGASNVDPTAFTDPGNWNPSGTPTTSNDIAEFTQFAGPFTSFETVDGDGATTGQLLVDSNNQLTLSGDLTTTGIAPTPGGVFVDGTLTVAAGATLNDSSGISYVGDSGPGDLTVNGTVNTNEMQVGLNEYHWQGEVGDSTLTVSHQGVLNVADVYLYRGILKIDDTATVSSPFIGFLGTGVFDNGLGGTLWAISDGTDRSQTVTVSAELSVDGLKAMFLKTDDNVTLKVTGEIIGGGQSGIELGGGTVNLGSVQAGSYQGVDFLTVDGGSTLEFIGPGTQDLGNIATVTNYGNVLVAGGMDLENVALSNLSAGTLSATKWTVTGAGSTVNLLGSAITTLDTFGTVVLGAGATFETTDGNGTTTTLEQSLTTIGSYGRLIVNRGTFASMSSTALEVENGGILQVANGGTLSNDSIRNGNNAFTLDSGGILRGSGTVAKSITANTGSTISALRGTDTLTFDGTVSTFAGRLAGSGIIDLEGLNHEFRAGASLRSSGLTLGGGSTGFDGNFSYAGNLTIQSDVSLEVDSNRFNASKATTTLSGAQISHGSLYLGSGTVDGYASIGTAYFIESGTLTLSSGAELDVTARETGTGTLAAGGNSTINLGGTVSAKQTVQFSNAGSDLLVLTNPSTFHGHLSNFGSSDTLDLAIGTAGEKFTYTENSAGTGGTLKVTSGSDRAVIAFDGQFVASGFHLTPIDGGTAVTYTAPTQNAPNMVVAHA